MGMIQTGLLVRLGHRPLIKFPLEGNRKKRRASAVGGARRETRDEIVNVAQSVRLEEVMRGEQPNESAVSCSVSSTCLVSQDKNLFNCHTEAGFHHVCTVGHNQ